jgi:hypothetical protein
MDFWTDAIDDTFYLDAQADAVERGMILKRVFLLRPEDCIPGLESAIRPHFEMDLKYRDNPNVELSYCKISAAQMVQKLDHFAIIRRKAQNDDEEDHIMLVEPVYAVNGMIIKLLFRFSDTTQIKVHNEDIRFHVKRFEKFAKTAKPLSELIPST